MSYTPHRNRGKAQWESWTRGLKQATQTYGPEGRQAARSIVRSLKKATHRAERVLSKHILRRDIQEFEAEQQCD